MNFLWCLILVDPLCPDLVIQSCLHLSYFIQPIVQCSEFAKGKLKVLGFELMICQIAIQRFELIYHI